MRTKRSETERRMRLMAKAKVDMLMGCYNWPDHRPALLPSGAPVVSNREILRVGGYSPDYAHANKILFEDPYFVAQVRTDMARRESKMIATISEQPKRLTKIANMLLDELETRLVNDPTSFSNTQILQAAREYRVAAIDEEKAAPDSTKPSKMTQFNAFINNSLTVLNETERENLVENAAQAAEERVAVLQRMIDNVTIREEEQDDSDVIDVEISPVPA